MSVSPGPYEIGLNVDPGDWLNVVDDDGNIVCLVESVKSRHKPGSHEPNDDAKLLAASWDLRELLERIVDKFEGEAGLELAMTIGIDADIVAARVLLAELKES